jgi:Tetratricopeptide repeat
LGSCNDEKLMESVGSNFAYNTEGFALREKASLLEKLPEGKPKQDILRSLAQVQIRRGQYNQAMELLNDMPDSTDRDHTVQQLGSQWAEFDPKAAEKWLKLQPDSSDRDLAVAGFATVLARTDPQAAVKWADTIPDEAVRSGLLKDIAFLWLKADPANAEAWLTGVSELSDSDKDALRKTAQTEGGDRASTSVNVSDRR